MTPNVTLTNHREFQATLKAIARDSSRTNSQVINGQALAVALRAVEDTKRANRERIAHELGQIATKIRIDRKTGRAKAGRRVYDTENSVAANILWKRYLESGDPSLHRVLADDAEMARRVRRFISARIRSAGFIASGWLWAVRAFARRVGLRDQRKSFSRSGVRALGVPKGEGRPAPAGDFAMVRASIVNTALLSDDKSNPLPVAVAGLDSAMGRSITDMREHMRKRYREIERKYSAK